MCVCFFPLVCFLRSFIGAFFRLFSLFIYLFVFVFVYIFMYRRRKDATIMLPTIYLFLFLFIFSCIDAEKTQQSCYLLNFLTRNPEVMEFKLDSSSGLCDIECFHVTSRRSYWCPKTMKRRPCWYLKPIL